MPPQGYIATAATAPEFSSTTDGIFEDLDGKQIWHISAPGTMPITKLEDFDLSTAMRGSPILEHNGVQYVIDRVESDGVNLLLPKGVRGEYAVAGITFSKSLRIRESSTMQPRREDDGGDQNISEPKTESTQFFAVQSGRKKPPREQPANLRVRYVPFGTSEAKEYTAESSITNDESALLKDPAAGVHQSPESSKKSSKKKQMATEDTIMDDATHKSPRVTLKSVQTENSSLLGGSQKKKKEKRQKLVP